MVFVSCQTDKYSERYLCLMYQVYISELICVLVLWGLPKSVMLMPTWQIGWDFVDLVDSVCCWSKYAIGRSDFGDCRNRASE